MRSSLALVTVMFWVIIPVFWIPVHGANRLFRKLGILTYLILPIMWMPMAYLVYHYRAFLLRYAVDLPAAVHLIGGALLLCGTLLHVWTVTLLGKGIIGLLEVSKKVEGYLVTIGPYSVIRHPTYFAHTLMFCGIFLITGVIATAIVTLLDFVIVNAAIIPLEDRELSKRFGEEYRTYKERVPSFFPTWHPFL